MEPGESATEARLRALEEAVRRLEQRLNTGVPVVPVNSAATVGTGETAAQPPSGESTGISGSLAGAALLFVVLLFALVLRLGAESGFYPSMLGPAVGVGYCVLLLGVSGQLFRRNALMGRLLAATATLSCFLVVLETYHRRGTLELPAGLVALAALAVASVLLGRRMESSSVTALGLVGGAVVGTFLDLRSATLWWVAAGLAAVHAASAWVAWGRPARWGLARWPLAANALVLTWAWGGKLAAAPLDEKLALAGPSVLLMWAPWLLAAAYKGAGARRPLDAFESVTPALFTVAPYAVFVRDAATTAVAAAVAAGMLTLGAVQARAGNTGTRTCEAFVAGGFALGVLTWPHLPVLGSAAGPVIALAALALFRATSAGPECRVLRGFTHLFQLGAAVRLAWAGVLFTASPTAGTVVAAGITGGAAWAHYALGRRVPAAGKDGGEGLSVTALASLAACALALHGALRGLAGLAVGGTGPSFQAAQSLAAAALVACGALVARRRQWRDLAYITVGASLLVAAKVVLVDLITLPGSHVLLPVLAVAVLLAVVSVALRGTAPAARPAASPPAP